MGLQSTLATGGGLTIKRLAIASSLLLLATFASISLQSIYAINEVKVGGTHYVEIIDGKDLVADILPPPLYPVDAYAVVAAIETDPGRLPELKARLAGLRKLFDERFTFWQQRGRGVAVRHEDWNQLEEIFLAARDDFWNTVENSYIPAAEKNDIALRRAAFVQLTKSFDSMQQQYVDASIRLMQQVADAERSVDARAKTLAQITTVFGAVGISLAIVVMLGLLLRVVRPLSYLAGATQKLVNGELNEPIVLAARNDELGKISKALDACREVLVQNRSLVTSGKQVISALGDALGHLSGGNLHFRINIGFPGELDQLRKDFNGAAESLAATIALVQDSADKLRDGTTSITKTSDEIARRIESQCANLEETAAAVSEIASTVKSTAGGAEAARLAVGAAKTEADRGGEVVKHAMEAMNNIAESSRQITQIISVIDEIAFQTNLLALNAGVEAARAGDSGRGFAVVASEVRALAQRSADAAKEIKALLDASAQQVNDGVSLVTSSGESLAQIIGRISEVNEIVHRISESAGAEAASLQEVNTAVSQMDQVTQENAAKVEHAASAVHDLAQLSGHLAVNIAHFVKADEASLKVA